jgi:hypothetical protein
MLLRFVRNRTSTCIVMYSVYLYFHGSSLRNTYKALEPFKDQNRSHALEPFKDQNRSHVAVWKWIQRFGSSHIYNKHRRISAFIIDETVIQIGSHISGYGSVLNQYIGLYLEYIFQKKGTCLLLENSFDPLAPNMVNIQFTQMVVLGTLKLVRFYI